MKRSRAHRSRSPVGGSTHLGCLVRGRARTLSSARTPCDPHPLRVISRPSPSAPAGRAAQAAAAAARAPPPRRACDQHASSERGNASIATGVARRARIAAHVALATNSARHHRHHRPSVRPLTARRSHSAWRRRAVRPCASAVASTTTAPRKTRRPRKRTDSGVIRRRHPSRSQQKLSRRL